MSLFYFITSLGKKIHLREQRIFSRKGERGPSKEKMKDTTKQKSTLEKRKTRPKRREEIQARKGDINQNLASS